MMTQPRVFQNTRFRVETLRPVWPSNNKISNGREDGDMFLPSHWTDQTRNKGESCSVKDLQNLNELFSFGMRRIVKYSTSYCVKPALSCLFHEEKGDEGRRTAYLTKRDQLSHMGKKDKKKKGLGKAKTDAKAAKKADKASKKARAADGEVGLIFCIFPSLLVPLSIPFMHDCGILT